MISVCMVVKNELETLPEAYRSVVDHVDEIVIVDTGSTDGTQYYAKHLPKVVFAEKDFTINGEFHFSEARNYAMSLASGDWLMTLDADDRVADDWAIIRQILTEDNFDVLLFDIQNVYEKGRVRGRFSQARMFRKAFGPAYVGQVHNQLTFTAPPPDGVRYLYTPVRVRHIGYGMISHEKLAAKIDRGIRMCRAAAEATPDEAFVWLNLATALRNRATTPEEYTEIMNCLEKVIALTSPRQEHLKTQAIGFLAWAYYYQKRYDDAIEWAKQALERKRNYLDAILLMCYAWGDSGNETAAEFWAKRYVQLADRYAYETFSDGVVQERVDEKATVYKMLAAIEEFKKHNRPVVAETTE